MKTKHTTPPWTLMDKGDYGDFEGQSRVIIQKRKHIRLAAVHVNNEESEANAVLMTAAPELLKACEKAFANLEFSEAYALVDQLRDAIAKAKGQP